MSGYSTENHVLKYLLDGPSFNNQPKTIQLQEGDLANIAINDDTRDHLDIVFCRIFDLYINEGHDSSIIDRLSDTMGCDIVDAFLSRVGDGHDYKLLSILSEKALYRDKDRWRAIINDPFVLRLALYALEEYHSWWIMNYGQDGALTQRPENIESSYDSLSVDRYKYCSIIFPAVSFSLSLISKNFGEANIIKHIALDAPIAVPDMVANDLWLQRRALLSCVELYGSEFIIDNLKHLWCELIGYVLLKGDLSAHEQKLLKEAIVIKKQREVYALTKANNVKVLVDKLIREVAE